MNAKQYLICLRCNREEFVIKSDAIFEQVFKGETLKVESPGMACQHCGYVALGTGQLDELRKRTADAYREKHQLLTSAQIKAHREELHLSQRQFAQRLGVGEASVKRWETWLVQEKGNDELIRMKVAKMLEEQLVKETIVLWLDGHCAKGTSVTMSAGIQWRPVQEETEPNWRLAHSGQTAPSYAYSFCNHVTTLPDTA